MDKNTTEGLQGNVRTPWAAKQIVIENLSKIGTAQPLRYRNRAEITFLLNVNRIPSCRAMVAILVSIGYQRSIRR